MGAESPPSTSYVWMEKSVCFFFCLLNLLAEQKKIKLIVGGGKSWFKFLAAVVRKFKIAQWNFFLELITNSVCGFHSGKSFQNQRLKANKMTFVFLPALP